MAKSVKKANTKVVKKKAKAKTRIVSTGKKGVKKIVGKAGRPKIVVDEMLCGKIHSLAAVGGTWDMISIKVGIGRSTLQRSPEAMKAFAEGKADANLAVGGAAFTMAKSGMNSDMTKFWLKTQAGWRENQGLIDVNITEKTEIKASDVIKAKLAKLAIAMTASAKKKNES